MLLDRKSRVQQGAQCIAILTNKLYPFERKLLFAMQFRLAVVNWDRKHQGKECNPSTKLSIYREIQRLEGQEKIRKKQELANSVLDSAVNEPNLQKVLKMCKASSETQAGAHM